VQFSKLAREGGHVLDEGWEGRLDDERPHTRITDAYSFSVFPYESHLVGIVSIHTGGIPKRPKRCDPYLAFSRGDHILSSSSSSAYPIFRRPDPGDKGGRSILIDYPQAKYSSVTSFALHNRRLGDDTHSTIIYAASTPYEFAADRKGGSWDWPVQSAILIAILRRDGFVALVADSNSGAADKMTVAEAASVSTKWIRFAKGGASQPINGHQSRTLHLNVDGCAAGDASMHVRVETRCDDDDVVTGTAERIGASVTGMIQVTGEAVVQTNGTDVDTGIHITPGAAQQCAYRILFTWSSPDIKLYSFWLPEITTAGVV
jgi:hypothetical protein